MKITGRRSMDIRKLFSEEKPLDAQMADAIIEMFASYEKHIYSINFIGSMTSDNAYESVARYKALLPKCRQIVEAYHETCSTPLPDGVQCDNCEPFGGIQTYTGPGTYACAKCDNVWEET